MIPKGKCLRKYWKSLEFIISERYVFEGFVFLTKPKSNRESPATVACNDSLQTKTFSSTLASVENSRYVLGESLVNVNINGKTLIGLIDTGASENFKSKSVAKKLRLNIREEFGGRVSLADRSKRSKISGRVSATISLEYGQRIDKGVPFTVWNNLVIYLIIRLKLLRQNRSLTIHFDETKDTLVVEISR